jgi:hypothetical protein
MHRGTPALLADALLSAIPLVGDAFDFIWIGETCSSNDSMLRPEKQ